MTVTAADADAGTFKAVGLPAGLSIDPNSGVISGTIGLGAAGSYAVTVTASDNGFVGSASFTWTVNDSTPPALTSPGSQTNHEGDTVSLAIQAVDADPGTFMAVGLPTGLSINATTGVISETLAAGTAGAYTVTVTASDNGVVGSVAFSWSVSAVGSKAPTLANPGPQTSPEGASVSLTLHATNADRFSANGLPPGLSINPKTGVISGVVGARAQGTYAVTVTAFNVVGSVSVVFNWKVKDATPPALTNPGTQQGKEGERVSLAIQSVDAHDFRAVGLPPGLRIDPRTGVISGVIGRRAAGTYTVTVTATDAGRTDHRALHVESGGRHAAGLEQPGEPDGSGGRARPPDHQSHRRQAGQLQGRRPAAGLAHRPEDGCDRGRYRIGRGGKLHRRGDGVGRRRDRRSPVHVEGLPAACP